MSKYLFAGLDIELTRNCNLQCAHCMRGPAQNVTMSTEIIDKLVDNVSDCVEISISGGETLAEIERFEYLVNKVSQWPNLIRIGLVTNGTILNSKLIEIAEKFCTQDTRRFFSIGISKDEFHPAGAGDNAHYFYKPLVDSANERLGKDAISLKLHEVAKENMTCHGRAKQIIDKAGIDDLKKRRLKALTNKTHRLKITDNVVRCAVGVTAHGDIVINCGECSYDEIDAATIGNIMDCSLDDIIENHQNNCLVLCNELNFDDVNLTRSVISNFNKLEFVGDVQIRIMAALSERIVEVRKTLKEKYPQLTASDIITHIPMPINQNEFNSIIFSLYESSPYEESDIESLRLALGDEVFYGFPIGEDVSENAKVTQMIFMIALAVLSDHNVIDIMTNKVYRNAIKFLELRAALYDLGGQPDNSKVFPCESSEIFSNKYYDSRYEHLWEDNTKDKPQESK